MPEMEYRLAEDCQNTVIWTNGYQWHQWSITCCPRY